MSRVLSLLILRRRDRGKRADRGGGRVGGWWSEWHGMGFGMGERGMLIW